MRLFNRLRLCKFRLIILITFILLIAYTVRKYWPYLYNVAHGDLPCFANESTRHKIRHMLFSFHELMTKENLTYWIDYGTLLGSTRRHGMIPYDHDADAAYLLKDITQVSKNVAPALKSDFGVLLEEKNPVQMRYQGTQVDLFVYGTYPDIRKPVPIGKTNVTLTRAFYRLSQWFEETYSDADPDDILPPRLCVFEDGSLMCPNKPGAILNRRYPYTYWLNLRVPFKLRCYLNVFDLIRIIFYGE